MKRITLLAALLALVACNPNNTDPQNPSGQETPETPETPTSTGVETPAFALGADISWASEMENGGRTFQKKSGAKAELTEVLKDCGVNAIRLRVWVNPYKSWSGKADVVAVAKKVKAAGLALMIDFHYSDFFADPSRQLVPSAWEADKNDVDKLCTRVASHTKEVLQALKDAGVDVHWVQVGNETRNGMLWPAGQLWTNSGDVPNGRSNFAKLYNAGYDAAKAVYPSALVMPHLNNAYEDNDWWFSQIKAAGGKFDAIALSHYPQAESGMTAAQYNSKAVSRIKELYKTYRIPVIVSEIGVKQKSSDGAAVGAAVLEDFMTQIRSVSGCKGVFYWEPETDGTWKPEIYDNQSELRKYSGDATTDTWNAYDMGAFTTSGAPSAIMDAFR